jgi:hypothetical protein
MPGTHQHRGLLLELDGATFSTSPPTNCARPAASSRRKPSCSPAPSTTTCSWPTPTPASTTSSKPAKPLLKQPKILIFDEAASNLDRHTAEHFAKTINKLKGRVTMLFITHQIPRGLQVDEVFSLGTGQGATRMEVVEDERWRDGEDKW